MKCSVLVRVCVAQYEMTGASRRYGTSCSYDFFSNRITKTGALFSPLYPRNYPPFSRCQYAFHALPGEVVRLQFNRIRLDKTDEHMYVLLGVPRAGEAAERLLQRVCLSLCLTCPTNYLIRTSRWALDRVQTHAGHSIAFLHFVTL